MSVASARVRSSKLTLLGQQLQGKPLQGIMFEIGSLVYLVIATFHHIMLDNRPLCQQISTMSVQWPLPASSNHLKELK